jgi:hypothetical protein
MHLLFVSSLITLWTWTGSSSASLITPRPPHPTPFPNALPRIAARQTTTFGSTCGYLDDNALEAWTADPGYNCRQDTSAGVWGFCPNTIQDVSECSIAGFCIDNSNCASGCGVAGQRTLEWYANSTSTPEEISYLEN